MSSSVLPDEFRCFRHITHIYARNLPLHPMGATVQAADDGGIAGSALDTPTLCDGARLGCRTSQGQRCVSSYFVLSLPPGKVGKMAAEGGNRRIYTSEVRRETQQPVWDHIPKETIEQFKGITRFVFSLYYCTTHPEESIASPETDCLFYEMLIQTSHVQYVAASMTKADSLPNLPYHVENRPNSFVVLLRCMDGVFFPKHQGVQVDEGGEGMDFIKTPYLHEDSDPTRLCVDAEVMRARGKSINAPVEKITLGDLKTFATATLAWTYLSELAVGRRGERQAYIDDMMDSRREEVAIMAQRAMLEARLAKAREDLGCRSSELLELRGRYKEEQESMMLQMAQLEKLQSSTALEEVQQQEANKMLNEQELPLSTLRAQLGTVRRLRFEELRTMFPIHVDSAGLADTICGHYLPVKGKEVGVTSDVMHDWGLALGAAAHLVATAATIYGCSLPHPLLLCGGRCCVMAKPGLPVAAVVSPFTGPSDVKLPLYCARTADRPLMSAAMQLLSEDVAALARAMGHHDIAANAMDNDGRLAVILKQLLLLV
ncbi:hypothetical protein ECC02_004372 [Trypanosoma cruzi]|uniref:Uncharacterized protein n=1 Tax=Trypanosoma cruzi TaxID=5693 RepID=A0A7J6Y713_TRYCR|nr:hypothetical protein ECC02_004372 [Trypanosoma cruzi]